MEKYFDYLDKLRASGKTNMYGAAPYLQREFPWLDYQKAKEVLFAWMELNRNEVKTDA